jgi:hypothetical protein
LFAACGPEVIKRIEVLEGIQSANGQKALMLGSVNFYIPDLERFAEATSSDAEKQIAAEEAKFNGAPPIHTLMQVNAVG